MSSVNQNRYLRKKDWIITSDLACCLLHINIGIFWIPKVLKNCAVKYYQKNSSQVKETRQQKKVTAAPVRSNLDQGFDGRVGSYWYRETVWREGSRAASELGENLSAGIWESGRNNNEEKPQQSFYYGSYWNSRGVMVEKEVCGIYIHKQVINRKRKRLSK